MNVSEEIENNQGDLEELKKLLEISQRSKVKETLNIEIRKRETKLGILMEQQNGATNTTGSAVPKLVTTNSNNVKTYDYVIRNYSWEESDKLVKIYLTGLDGAKEIDSSNIAFNATPISINFKINNLNGKNWSFEIKELSSTIDHEKSYYKAKSDMVLLVLCKRDQGSKWKYLKKSEKIHAEKPAFTPDPVSEGEDPSQGLMNMMKKMYSEGDDEMKRTIAKAWTESSQKGGGGGMPGMGGMGGMDL